MTTEYAVSTDLGRPDVGENTGVSPVSASRPLLRAGFLGRIGARLRAYLFPPPERPFSSVRGFTEISPYGEVPAPDIW